MCQPKSLGGKRCFAHHPQTKATLNYVHLKTGIDKEQIYGIMKELHKEGRKLEAPTPEELEKYFDLEEFKTKYDNKLEEKEKVAILKQLLTARSVAKEQGVSGGVFHAWKNALSRTVSKMKKPFVALALSGTLLLSACTGGGGVTPPSETTAPPTSSPVVACSTENPGPYGDAVPLEAATDEYGEYCRTTIDPTSDALVYDASKVDLESLEKYGFTEEEAKEAQITAVTFLMEQTFDSTRLDNYSQSPTEWLNENADSLSSPDVYLDFVNSGEQLSSAGLIVTDYLPTPVIRNGGPRFTQTNVQVNEIVAFEGNGKKAIAVRMSANSFYPAENADIVSMYLANHPDMTEDALKQSQPELFEEAPVGLSIQGAFSLSFVKDNYDQVAGSNSSWTVNTQTGNVIVE